MVRSPHQTFGLRAVTALILTGALAACGGSNYQASPDRDPSAGNRGSLFRPTKAGVAVFTRESGGEGSLAVNAFLWRASLDTIAFMPLASADPFGGVIITDWYSPAETPDERFKVNVYILGKQLRADGLKVSVFRQQRTGGQWNDANVEPEVPGEFENAVLGQARELRLRATAQDK
jgi:Domain of unknown function (DUF3576)